LEIELSDVGFATWEESHPFDWQKYPIALANGKAVLRSRILPARLRVLKQAPPLRLASYGRVYNRDDEIYPMRNHSEGFVVDKNLTRDTMQSLWSRFAASLFGLGSTAKLETAGADSFRIFALNIADGKIYEIGCTGPASPQALKACGVNSAEYSGWTFVIDVDQFALQYFSLDSRAALYENDVTFLSKFKTDSPSAGYTPEYAVSDTLRQLGYVETTTNTLYPDGIYKKMNMIQDSWDTNNAPMALIKPLGSLAALRTVLSPATEGTLALNYQKGVASARIFEVAHIFSPVKDSALPHERYTIAMGAYGPDVNLESFTKDVEAVLESFGISYMFVPNETAIAYNVATNECRLVLTANGKYLDGNFGRISEKACENFGIGVPAYMANLELPALVQAATK
jgi:hypothetical protein